MDDKMIDEIKNKAKNEIEKDNANVNLNCKSNSDKSNTEVLDKLNSRNILDDAEEPADDELLEILAKSQIRANYRKSLGKEYIRKSWDEEIKRIFKKNSK